MRSIVDSVIGPLLTWLIDVYDRIMQLSVPLSRPIDFGKYFGYFTFLGAEWLLLISQTALLAFIYLVAYIVMSNIGLLRKFKDLIKWW